MARTLTEQEQHTLQRFRDRLLHALSSEEKGYAAGIASALVRFRGAQITEMDLERILSKYDAPTDSLLGAIKNQLLKPVDGQDGTYTLRTKDAKALPAADKQGKKKQADDNGADDGTSDENAKTDTKKSAGERKPRRRSRKKADAKAEGDNATQADAAKGAGTQDTSAEEHAGKRPAKRSRRSKAAAENDEKPAASNASEAEDTAGETEAPKDAAEQPTMDIAPGRSMRKAAQARNEADEAALSSAAGTDEDADGAETAGSVAAADAGTTADGPATDTQDGAEDDEAVSSEGTAQDAAEENDAADGSASDGPDRGEASEGTDAAESADAAEASDSAGEADDSGSEGTGDADAQPEDTADNADGKDKRPHHGKKKKHERDPRRIPYVRRGDEDDAAIRQKIIGLDQRFWMNGWLLSHPGAYVMFEHELNAMSDALADGDVLPGDITRRQLAYQMGGDEKFFEYGSDGFRLLRAMGLESIIRHRPLPKIDLVYHAPRRRKRMRVLVTENLDPYLDVHDLMYEEGRSLFLGERIHAVVLGGGTPILEHNRLSLLLDTLGADHIDVLYWGDIDRAGLELMCKLKEILGDKYGFEPFTPAYRLMIQKAMERFPDPGDNEITNQDNVEVCDIDFLCQGLTDEEASYARAVIENCCLIPQEILTKRDL